VQSINNITIFGFSLGVTKRSSHAIAKPCSLQATLTECPKSYIKKEKINFV
jgi:hypothetical protein